MTCSRLRYETEALLEKNLAELIVLFSGLVLHLQHPGALTLAAMSVALLPVVVIALLAVVQSVHRVVVMTILRSARMIDVSVTMIVVIVTVTALVAQMTVTER